MVERKKGEQGIIEEKIGERKTIKQFKLRRKYWKASRENKRQKEEKIKESKKRE